ncbi:conserved Plasmodium protein, unknown function [Plasmodium ovale]|uniref:Uncharacterized protein n=1 Tax=Plasmodium ovale TaxID=36330 RepID=A0A1D3TIC0_PLAOA|nr:conserved Plasmodium protein, unknown function [Plasmodium ovale]
MVQNIKAKVKKSKITERKNKSKKPKNNKVKVDVKSLRKKSKLVKIDKIEEMAKRLCAATNNSLHFLNTKTEKKK